MGLPKYFNPPEYRLLMVSADIDVSARIARRRVTTPSWVGNHLAEDQLISLAEAGRRR